MFTVRNTETQHAASQHVLSSHAVEETLLDTAIDSASRTQLCQILRELCAHSKTATEMTRDHLIPHPAKVEAPKTVGLRSILKKPGSFERSSQLQQSSPAESIPPPNETPPSSQIASQRHVKRKAMIQCRNCGFDYSPTSSDVSVCVHHPGEWFQVSTNGQSTA